MTPANVLLALVELPIVRVALFEALPFLTKVVPGVALVFKPAMVALFPLRLKIPVEPEPNATVFSFNAPVFPNETVPALMVSPPVKVLAPFRVKIPLPDFVKFPEVVAIAPETVVSPAPLMMIFCAVPLTEAKVKSEPVLTVKVGAPDKVTAPKVTPAVPEPT